MPEPPPLEKKVRDALDAFLASVTIPILYDHETKGTGQLGTGTLFTLGGRLFLVTAAHLFDELCPGEALDPGRLAIPSFNADELRSLGPYQLIGPKESEFDFDIAVLELQDDATIKRARARWSLLTLANIAPASTSGLFILSGFPQVREKRTAGFIGGGRLTVLTARIDEPENAKPPVHPALDLFFAYDEEVINADTQEPIEADDLRGCSGASIWQYKEPEATADWTPEQCLRAVAVQTSFSPIGDYFRGKSWAAVLEFMRLSDEHLASIINDYKREQPQ